MEKRLNERKTSLSGWIRVGPAAFIFRNRTDGNFDIGIWKNTVADSFTCGDGEGWKTANRDSAPNPMTETVKEYKKAHPVCSQDEQGP